MTRVERLAALYFGGHAVVDVAWWIGVLAVPRFRGWFELDPSQHRSLTSFVAGDSVLLFVVSVLAAIAVLRGWRSAAVLAGVVTGASAYCALYLYAWVIGGGHGWIGVVAMTVETAIMAVLTALLAHQPVAA